MNHNFYCLQLVQKEVLPHVAFKKKKKKQNRHTKYDMSYQQQQEQQQQKSNNIRKHSNIFQCLLFVKGVYI